MIKHPPLPSWEGNEHYKQNHNGAIDDDYDSEVGAVASRDVGKCGASFCWVELKPNEIWQMPQSKMT